MHHPPALVSRPWERPSRPVQELIRRGATLVLRAPEEWLEEIDKASMSSESMRGIADDPVLAAAVRRANRSNLAH